MSQPRSTIVTGSEGPSAFPEVFRAELAVVAPHLALPAKAADEETDLAAIAAALDRPDTEHLAALCLSGGGIRSASFSLGALQGLARFGVLKQFHYLSTVSGGGYIGSWLSAWRCNDDDERVFAGLTSMQASGSEPSQITGIRADSNYITPKLGLFSADTWTVVAIYVRNLLLNWALFLPLFTGVLLVPHLSAAALAFSFHSGRPSRPWLVAGCLLLTISLACGVCGRFRARDLWLTQARFLQLVLAPMVLSAICFTIGAALGGIHTALALAGKSVATQHVAGAVAGLVIYALSWLIGRVAANRWDEKILVPDLICWILAGGLVGFLISLGLQSVEEHQSARLMAVLGLSGVVLAYLVGDVFYVGAASLSRRGDMDREWLARTSGWLAAVAVSWSAASALSIYASWLLLHQGPRWAHLAWAQALGIGVSGLSGIVTLLLGPSARTSATRAGVAQERFPFTRIASVAAVIFAASIGALLSILGQRLVTSLCNAAHGCDPARYESRWDPVVLAWLDPLVIGVLIGLSFFISLFVNVNRFSLHALYRNRLVRAFLGSARTPGQRRPDPFTGFDPDDNASLAAVVPRSGGNRLFHVINTTLDVVATRNPAWQERKAESFAMTRLHCGNPYVGYRPTSLYGGKRGGLTLGTAMAISGAAVSPNEGYSSSPLVGFLLMLFNVRLGWWLGNPSREFYRNESPLWSITPALKELAGATTDQGRWIYLSDGGHFDDLGLYEMVRRRCRFIVVIDAGCDPDMKFEDLGNAVRKSYIDFGVSIDFRKLEFQARQSPPVAGARFGLATISYPRHPPEAATPRSGWLLYIKPTYYCTTEGVDVRGYASDHPGFPHESTIDQWFSESQLEAYRALGAHIVEHICSGGPGPAPGVKPPELSLECLHSKAEDMLNKSRPQ
jgi:Patatin-like phospholipase